MYQERTWKCDCGAEVLGISFWSSEDPSSAEWFIEVYKMSGVPSFGWRVRQAMNLVLGRDVVVDAVSLDPDKVRDLITFLESNIAETERNIEKSTTEQTE